MKEVIQASGKNVDLRVTPLDLTHYSLHSFGKMTPLSLGFLICAFQDYFED